MLNIKNTWREKIYSAMPNNLYNDKKILFKKILDLDGNMDIRQKINHLFLEAFSEKSTKICSHLFELFYKQMHAANYIYILVGVN